ncbi:MAG: universal stress protein [Acidobacteria bacterium]|nr:universal stress protein [Acidobacteriota bacterium]
MKILIAYDASPDSEQAVDEVVARPWTKGSKVRLVSVVEPPLGTPPPNFEFYGPLIVGVENSLREEAYQRIQKAMTKFKGREDLEVSYELKEGSPKGALLEAIRDWAADLVVVGSHGRTRLERLFLGSVSHALVTHAPCSVEVVRTRRNGT